MDTDNLSIKARQYKRVHILIIDSLQTFKFELMKVIYLILFLFIGIPLWGQDNLKYRIWLADKPESEYRIDKPEDFLSEKAIERRRKYNIAVDETDLPVHIPYIEQIEQLGAHSVARSKWLNTVTVSVADSSRLDSIRALPFVKGVELVWKNSNERTNFFLDVSDIKLKKGEVTDPYGSSKFQISMHNGDKLHERYRGAGMIVAVIDAGFLNVDRNKTIRKDHILGTRDFVQPGSNVYELHNHGAHVLSIMLSVDNGKFIGSAPDAHYWLLRSEDSDSEYPVEEDYWAAAIEFADSVGVDVVNSSLGYYEFDDTQMNYTHADLDGHTRVISRAASLGAEKGLLIVNSAGNEGAKSWRKICFPADADNILTVGAVNNKLEPSAFSGEGYAADGRIKPEVTSFGTATALIDIYGNPTTGGGTSFSSPVIAGLATCLWQALPLLSNKEIIQLLIKNSSQYQNPDSLVGYGIPDVYAAYINSISAVENIRGNAEPELLFYPNGDKNLILLNNISADEPTYMVQIYTAFGALMYHRVYGGANHLIDLGNLPEGLYIINVQGKNFRLTQKFVKP